MLSNFVFTLYELLGYLLPGAVALVGFSVIEWALFFPAVPLRIAGDQANVVTGICVVLGSYILGHAMQAMGNLFWSGAEAAVLDVKKGNAPPWLKENAQQAARDLLNSDSHQLEPRWIFRALDECMCRRVAPVPNQPEGAPGASPLGTGEGAANSPRHQTEAWGILIGK